MELANYKKVALAIIIIIFIVGLYELLSLSNFNINTIEPLKETTYVVLMGDSIFDNKEYATSSVEMLLKKKHKKTLIIAKDGATIKDISKQINQIPIYYDKAKTKLIISVGGNDLLNQYVYHKQDYKNLDAIFEAYKSCIDKIKKLNYEVVLCNIYYPPYKKIKPYHKFIKEWNERLYKYADKNKLEVLKIDDVLTQKAHFSNYIEPSTIGGKKIVNKITNLN